MAELRRRSFVIRSCKAISAALVSRIAWPFSRAIAARPEFHVHPHYRAEPPVNSIFAKIQSGKDEFLTELYQDQLAAILQRWSESLLQSASWQEALESIFAVNFLGASRRPLEVRSLRSGGPLSADRITFSQERSLRAHEFLAEQVLSLSDFTKILVAEFQITEIMADTSDRLFTTVRYEIAGTGKSIHREQRVGNWELEWIAAAENTWRLLSWKSQEETRSRAKAPIYQDISSRALGGVPSYSNQLQRGVDHWRTVLDSACGIDVYGHNGVSVGDIDGDGFDDLYLCQPAGLPNRLYRNRGDGTFEDVTEASGVGLLDNTSCALFADFNNDGKQDLIVVRASGPQLFLNDGGGKFRLRPDAFQFASPPQGTFTGAAVADYNRDGWLDIYFCLYVYYQGTDQYKYPAPYYDAENGPPNFLLKNNRDGSFSDVTSASGLNQNNTRFSFCCAWNDYNQDGWPDLYVVNDFGRKNLYRNNGDGTFTDIAPEAGVEDVGAGMSVAWFDYDNDGREDLYVGDMWTAAGERVSANSAFQKDSPKLKRDFYRKHAMGNSLFRNGQGFTDTTHVAGVGMGRWSWSSDAWDFDHDGWADLYITNGMISGPLPEDLNSFFWRQVVAKSLDTARISDEYEQGWNAVNEAIRADYSWSGLERNVFYANNGDGTFSDVSAVVGLDFLEDGRAFALADLDHDGRLEVFLKNRNSPQLRVLKNVMANLPPSIAFRLRGTSSNRDAIGAVVTLKIETGMQVRTLQAGSGFLSQHSKEIFFGLGKATGALNVSVRWPNGGVQNFQGVPSNHRIWIEEGSDAFHAEPFSAAANRNPVVEATAAAKLPIEVETWLLTPVPAPDFPLPGSGRLLSSFRGRCLLLMFTAGAAALESHIPVLSVDATGRDENDTVAIYSILFRSLFDRHRELPLPTSFLIDAQGMIVKVYQGAVNAARIEADQRTIPRTPADRLSLALPFGGVSTSYGFGRNYLSLGSLYFQHGYFEHAGPVFELAAQEDPASAEASYGLGSVYLKAQRNAEARSSFEDAVKRNASYPNTKANAWNNLGLLAAKDRGADAAIACFEEALRINPDLFVALENLGIAYRQAHRWDQARHTLEQALEMRPKDAETNYNLAMVFAQSDDIERAREYLQRALTANPNYPEALNNLGILYVRTGRRDEAVSKFEECIRVAPAFTQAYVSLGAGLQD